VSGAAAPSPSGAYLVNLAEEHAAARGFNFDESARGEFRRVADRAIVTARDAGIYTVQDILYKVRPNTIRLTDATIGFAEGVVLTVSSVRAGLSSICPLFPFC
jgi:hypothetical protein